MRYIFGFSKRVSKPPADIDEMTILEYNGTSSTFTKRPARVLSCICLFPRISRGISCVQTHKPFNLKEGDRHEHARTSRLS